MFAIPAARAPSPVCWCSKSGAPVFLPPKYLTKCSKFLAPLLSPIRPAIVRRQVYFPDRRLIQFDCGKLQKLAILLRRLKSEGHRALIFTQMTKMLDILEAFINLYGYTYMRLDGSTRPEERQTLMQRFNTNPKIFLFILSTRSGGVGINLVGADTVIFYDSDWNPAMDQQAQDRCHRIGQTREVHIYRLISESTIEENILKKANQKRALDVLVIQSGSYNTEFFKKLDPVELFSDHSTPLIKNLQKERNPNNGMGVLFSNVDVEAALKDAEDEADYMALKRVEEEEAVDNQEFTDEAIGRLEDDEFVNEDHLAKCDEHEDISTSPVTESDPKEERALTLVGKEEDADMIADVQKMAAVGQANSFFENHLRPIDRYAMRFLDLWDPVVDKSAIESQVHFEETEWELDRIEQLKEDMEAEIDDDEEPSIYERWDVDVATEAYREEVKALAERQLMEELESEAKEAEEAEKRNCESRNEASTETKRKPKKKVKKKKFKSLKKEALASGSEIPREESSMEPMMIDDDHIFPEDISHSPGQRKRKRKIIQTYPAVDEEKVGNKKSKKLKRSLMERESHRNIDVEQNGSDEVMETQEIVVIDLDQKPVSRSKMRGKMSITAMPIKRVLVIKPEKLKKKGNIWSRACNDLWTSHEDAILCAIVHEYGTQWSFVSDALYGVCGGGFYRGRIRHPVHCCERFRELFQRYVVSSSTDNPNNEKVSNAGPGKAVFKVTEESIKTLLDITSDLPDNELLIQKHFTAVLSSVWKKKSRLDHWQTLPSTSQNGFDLSGLFSGSTPYQNSKKLAREPLVKMNLTLSEGHHGNLVAAALHDAERKQDNPVVLSRRRDEVISTVEQLKITLEFQTENEDLGIPFPSAINLLIEGTPDPEFSCLIDEKCFRFDSKACLIGENSDLAASGSLRRESIKSRPTSSKQSLGKHKNSISDSIKSSKSKLLRTPTTVPTEEQHPNFKLTSTSPPSNMFNFCSNINDNLISDTENLEMIPHEYDPSVISGLEDCNLFPDLTDIG
ncbi:hypothetical protein GIB67_042942 [Kingdonia uniflora]|uniref:DNA helicase n=1 Tax=Kingdonia uniflora TaxID=39325 RepID=A0A7J7L5Z5_9MAGN|nr:hypothetical protein GIB67_042942 [Kingdonia uniflora]